MKLAHYGETDSLYIDLSDEPSVDRMGVTEAVVLDYGANGQLVGIDIDDASKNVQLHRRVLSGIDAGVERAPV